MASRGQTATLLDKSGEWQLITDLEHLVFPREIAVTAQRPDAVIWSRPLKSVTLVELTVPWEANLEASHERKLHRYHRLAVSASFSRSRWGHADSFRRLCSPYLNG